MRSENYSFFDEYAGPGDKAVCGNKTRTNLSFRAAAKQALLEVVQSAPNSIGYYARGKIDVSGSSSSCTKHQNLICEIGLQEKIDTILVSVSSFILPLNFCLEKLAMQEAKFWIYLDVDDDLNIILFNLQFAIPSPIS
ncbi:hypothetical protein AHAS_Ahas18G0157000 [Arachis hypogaea]